MVQYTPNLYTPIEYISASIDSFRTNRYTQTENLSNYIYVQTTLWSGYDLDRDYNRLGDSRYIFPTETTTTTAYRSITTNYSTCAFATWQDWPCVKQTPQERLREIIRSRLAPKVHSARTAAPRKIDAREMAARDTLRKVIGETQFRNFLKHGFISVRGKSGKVYQLFTGHDRTRVWLNGQLVEELCVILKGQFPPTDTLIVRYLMVINNEEQFRALANVSPGRRGNSWCDRIPNKHETLPQIMRDLRAA